MRVLIVETKAELATLWADHLRRQGIKVECAHDVEQATHHMDRHGYDVVVLNAEFGGGNGIAMADYASFRLPDARVILVTGSTFFSDGSVFNHIANARACVSPDIPSEDLANVVVFHGANTPR